MNNWQMKANREWMNRPADERFLSLTALHAHCEEMRNASRARVISSRSIQCAPMDGADDSRALVCIGPNGGPVGVTHWSFGQLAARAGAPAGYLRTLPAAMAADCINYGMQTRDVDDVGVLLHKPSVADVNAAPVLPVLRAATGSGYGRIWNSLITRALVDRFGDGLTGDFRVPGEFGVAVPVTKENTTLYASDRDMFVFLADEQHKIEIPNRRDGKPGLLSRGFFVWNSEVGAQTLGIATFLFDYICGNRIVWGGTQGSAQSVVRAIEDARAKRIGNDDAVTEFLAKRFTRSQVSAIKAAHLSDEARPIETLWDAATGATAYARTIGNQDARVDIEREAGRILEMAA